MRERENIYKLLSGTTNDSLQKNYKAFTIDPKTRYSAFDSKKVSNMMSLKSLYDTDDPENADFSVLSPLQTKEAYQRRAQTRRRLSSGGTYKHFDNKAYCFVGSKCTFYCQNVFCFLHCVFIISELNVCMSPPIFFLA